MQPSRRFTRLKRVNVPRIWYGPLAVVVVTALMLFATHFNIAHEAQSFTHRLAHLHDAQGGIPRRSLIDPGTGAATQTIASGAGSRPIVLSKPKLLVGITHNVAFNGTAPAITQKLKDLHDKPTLAERTGGYPEFVWPRNGDDLSKPFPGPEAFTAKKNPMMLVVYRGSFWGWAPPPHERQCPVPCAMTSNQMEEKANVVVLHGPQASVNDVPADKKGRLFAVHAMESEKYYSQLAPESALWDKVDIQMTTKMHRLRPGLDIVPCPYGNTYQYDNYTKVRPQMLNKTRLALFMHNNCGANSKRQDIVKILQKHLPVDCPGSCLHNYDPPASAQNSDPVGLVSNYKFYLSFENAFEDWDWVSSTFFRTLDAGTVPVYLGAPNILKYAPGPRSIIRACDFDSAEQLTDYLKYLDRNHTAYMEYLQWKETGPSPEFKSMIRTHDLSVFCQLCMIAARGQITKYDANIQRAILARDKQMDQFQLLNDRLDKERTVPCKGKTTWWKL